MFHGLRVEEPKDENLNPDNTGVVTQHLNSTANNTTPPLGNVESPYPVTTDSASPLNKSPKPPRKKKLFVPWTAEDYRAYKESKRAQTITTTALSVGTYAFLFEDIEKGLTYLKNVSPTEDYTLPEENSLNPMQDIGEEGTNLTDPTSTPAARKKAGNRATLYKAPLHPQKGVTKEEVVLSQKDEFDHIPTSRWTWDPGGGS